MKKNLNQQIILTRVTEIKNYLQQIKKKEIKSLCIISHSVLLYYLIQSDNPRLNIFLDYCLSRI